MVEASLARKLTAEFRSAIKDKPLRESLLSIADKLEFNLWLDRTVDPTILSSTDPAGSNAYQAITSLADSAGAEVFVIENIVLVGHRPKLYQLAQRIVSRQPIGMSFRVHWPELSTPSEALVAAGGRSVHQLPHDLWPAVDWDDIESSLAQLLVLGQFDHASLNGESSQSDDPQARIGALYPLGVHAKALRERVVAEDRRATVKEVGGELRVTATMKAHQAAVDAWLRTGAQKASKLDIDKVTFSLKLENAIAMNVFSQLAATAGLRLQVSDDATAACQNPVSLEAKDLSLRALGNRVAEAVAVQLQWTDQILQVSLAPR